MKHSRVLFAVAIGFVTALGAIGCAVDAPATEATQALRAGDSEAPDEAPIATELDDATTSVTCAPGSHFVSCPCGGAGCCPNGLSPANFCAC